MRENEHPSPSVVILAAGEGPQNNDEINKSRIMRLQAVDHLYCFVTVVFGVL